MEYDVVKIDRKRCVNCKTYLSMTATKCNKCYCTELEEVFHMIETVKRKQCPICFVSHNQSVKECGYCGEEI